ncbi:MAG TPA: glycosyltransferase [Micropepsaceae bacterium]|nr:glycosyltransferase [Micropepsaceae bacterium]
MPSIIVPARNNAEWTGRCLSSLLHSVNRLGLSCEFVLVDDASAPDEKILDVFQRHRTKATGHDTKIIRSRKHQHYSGVFSIGLHHATRDIVFFISNDMVLTSSFIEGLLLVSSLSRDIGIVRGTSNYTDSHPEHLVEPKDPLKTYQDIDNFSRSVFAANGCRYVEDKLLSGDAVLVKRALIEHIGVLDLRFFGYFGDIDYGMRAHLAGFKLVCAKGAWLFHEGSGHLRHDMYRGTLTFEQARGGRYALLEAAYQVFRKKWDLAAPEIWSLDVGAEVPFMELARSRRNSIALNCEIPASELDDLETH